MIAPASPSTNGNGQANGRPKQLGEISGRQGWPGGVGGYRGGWCGVPGGSPLNPLALPGWEANFNSYGTAPGWRGNYPIYRWVLKHPMAQSVRGKVFNRVIASKWTVDAPNENVRKWFETNLVNQREPYVTEALRTTDYGHYGFEGVWNQDDEGNYFVRFKPLLVDWAPPVEDDAGNFIGFNVGLRAGLTEAQRKAIESATTAAPGDKPGYAVRPNLPAAAFKALHLTFDGEAGSLWGRSILENVIDLVWKPWLAAAAQLVMLGGKLSNLQAYAMVPPGGYTDGDGTFRTYRQDAEDGVEIFRRNGCPIFVKPMPDPAVADAEIVAAYAGKSFVEFATANFGDNSPAVQYLKDLLLYYDGLWFHAYQQSPRAGMESTHGSRADSEQHTETDTLFVERIARLMTAPVQPFVDEMARLNFGLKKGQVTLRQMDINDPVLTFKQGVYSDLVTNTATGPTVAKGIGLTQLQNDVGVPVNTSLKPGDLENMLVEDQQVAADAKAKQSEAVLAAKGNAAPGAPPGKSVAMGRDSGVGNYGDPGYFRTIGGEPVFFHAGGGSGGRGFTRPGEANSYTVHTTAGTHTFTHREATAGHEANHTHPDGTTETATHATAGAARRDIAERAAAVEESARAAGTHLESRAVEAGAVKRENGGMRPKAPESPKPDSEGYLHRSPNGGVKLESNGDAHITFHPTEGVLAGHTLEGGSPSGGDMVGFSRVRGPRMNGPGKVRLSTYPELRELSDAHTKVQQAVDARKSWAPPGAEKVRKAHYANEAAEERYSQAISSDGAGIRPGEADATRHALEEVRQKHPEGAAWHDAELQERGSHWSDPVGAKAAARQAKEILRNGGLAEDARKAMRFGRGG